MLQFYRERLSVRNNTKQITKLKYKHVYAQNHKTVLVCLTR